MTALAHLMIAAEKGPLSNECVDRGIISFLSFIEWVEQLPYSRNSDRSEYRLVFDEECGVCSTKSALIKAVAAENGWENVKLFLGMFLMSEKTHPGVGIILKEANLESIPEAHTYLKINGEIRDVTGLEKGSESFEKSLQLEVEIKPDQIGEYKVNWHRAQMVAYSFENGMSPNSLWETREKCIAELSR
ncbi:MAG: hypothetical protein GQ574_01260 [Crocinitomix sp.]|nr:hypothetical protein [Crocinitomix sp.]